MSEPVFFASHFRIKPGSREMVTRTAREVADQLKADKPQTVLFLSFVDDGDVISFLHAFPDSDAMDAHVVGAGERAQSISGHVEPLGWEVYGKPSESALNDLRQAAAGSGVKLELHPSFVAGFLRLRI